MHSLSIATSFWVFTGCKRSACSFISMRQASETLKAHVSLPSTLLMSVSASRQSSWSVNSHSACYKLVRHLYARVPLCPQLSYHVLSNYRLQNFVEHAGFFALSIDVTTSKLCKPWKQVLPQSGQGSMQHHSYCCETLFVR